MTGRRRAMIPSGSMMDFSAYFPVRPAGFGNLLRMLVVASVVLVPSGAAQAGNAAASSSHGSMSGIQSVIVTTRDALQRRWRAIRHRPQPQQSMPQQPSVGKPDSN